MVFVSLPCACEPAHGRSTNRSGIGKTSAASVRNRLRHEQDISAVDSRRSQAARADPVTSAVIRLYRAVWAEHTRAFYARCGSGGACDQSFPPTTTAEAQVFFHATEVFSSRKVACKLHEDMAVRVLAAGSLPAHRALSDIRAMHLHEPGELFVKGARLAHECGLVTLDTIAVDGTRIRTNASLHKVMSFERRVRAAAELKCRSTPCQRRCSPPMKPSSKMPNSACHRSWSGDASG